MSDDLEVQRRQIAQLLGDGLATQWQHRAYDDAKIARVLRNLSELAPDDVAGKISISGFTLNPYIGNEDPDLEQACSTCMYFEAHRRYCSLPELKLAAEPKWSCVLWRI